MEACQRRSASKKQTWTLSSAVLVNSLLQDWNARIKFVDDTTALEVIPRCSASLMPIDLSWCDQVDYVIKKTNSRLYALRQLKRVGLNIWKCLIV